MKAFKTLFVLMISAVFVCAQPTLPFQYETVVGKISAGPSVGSGFLMIVSNSVYLVTARHVLFNDRDKSQPARYPTWSSRATFGTFAQKVGTNSLDPRIFDLDLEQLVAAQDVRYMTNHDIAMVKMERCNTNDEHIVYLRPGVTFRTFGEVNPGHYKDIRKFSEIVVGRDVILFGYPSSIGLAGLPQVDQDFPLLRRGIVAGINRARNTIILDCAAYQGDSGGPVIAVEHPFVNMTQTPVIGILTEWIPFQEVWENKRFGYLNQSLMNSGYSVVEPIDLIAELSWQ